VSLKIAFGGKGGVGKTSVTALLSRILADKNKKVIAIDADPVANLAAGLGIPEDKPITPIAQLSDFIAERTGAEPGTMGGFFTLNPKVDDIPDRFSLEKDGVKLLVLGTVEKGGSGCICPESTILKALMTHLVLYRDEMVMMDMEAGVEHLGRATSRAVDALIIVVNPGARSCMAAHKIKQLGNDIGINKVFVLGNRLKSAEDEELIRNKLPGFEFIGFLPELEELNTADRQGVRPFESLSDVPEGVFRLSEKLIDLDTDA